jgi:hypothetical protein
LTVSRPSWPGAPGAEARRAAGRRPGTRAPG